MGSCKKKEKKELLTCTMCASGSVLTVRHEEEMASQHTNNLFDLRK